DQPVALLHRAHEAAALAVSEQERDEIEIGSVGVGEGDARIGQLDRGALERAREQRGAQRALGRLGPALAPRAARRAPLERALHALEQLRAIEAADRDR